MDYIHHYDSQLGGITLASDGEIAARIACKTELGGCLLKQWEVL